MDQLLQYLPFLLPVLAIQIVMMVIALVHIFKHTRYRRGNRVLWVLVVVFLELAGPVLYFALGKDDEA